MADMDTIAQMVGVSKTTVHRALLGTGRISDATRERILEAARQVGYRPNRVARSLRTQRTETIGVVVTSLAGSFYGLMLDGIESAAQEAGHAILLTCSHRDPDKERALVEMLLEKHVDGLILAPADPNANGDFYLALVRQGMPLVFLDRSQPDTAIDAVSTDNVQGGALAAQHLLSAGCRRIAFLTTPSPQRRYTSVLGRLEGCNRVLQANGLEPALVLGPNVPDNPSLPQFGYEAVRRYLRTGGALDGLFAVSDDGAIGALNALLEAGLNVPQEVSVVGFGDEGMAAFVRPSLTTIRPQLHQIGERAVELLFRRLQKDNATRPPEQMLFAPSLIVRQSSSGQADSARCADP